MGKTELLEEIRALLAEPQAKLVSQPWTYGEDQIIPQIRSALRHLTAKGVTVTGVMGIDGVFTTDPGATEGLLIALFVAERLLSGDLVEKLRDGELGVVFRAGNDLIDTKTAARGFEAAAARYREEFRTLLTVALSGENVSIPVFGDPEAYQA